MTELEMQLLSWTPRRPSPGLEKQLFAARPALLADALPASRFGWLAPATAVLAVMCVLFNQRHVAKFPASADASPMVAMILSNQSAPAYLPGSFQAEQNNVPANLFNWASSRSSNRTAPAISPSRKSTRP